MYTDYFYSYHKCYLILVNEMNNLFLFLKINLLFKHLL